jgi:hypothetical protein
MNFESIMDILNKPIVIATLGAFLVYGLNRLYASKPKWAKYEGTIISAVKSAEKAIPDDTDNKGLARLNNAMQYVIKIYEAKHGKAPTAAMRSDLQEGIQIVHEKLDSAGTLKKS